jgi:hypothetical protein
MLASQEGLCSIKLTYRTIKIWNQILAEVLVTFPCKPKILRKRVKKAIINGVKRRE